MTISYTDGGVTKTADVGITVKAYLPPETGTDIGSIPAGGASFACNGATSHWYATYGDDAFSVVAIVEDDSLYAGSNYYVSDGIELGVYKAGTDTGIADGAVKVQADMNGRFTLSKADSGAYVELDESEITVQAEIPGNASAAHSARWTIPIGTGRRQKNSMTCRIWSIRAGRM